MSMCDYSLDFVASRPVRVGDKLVTTKFKKLCYSWFRGDRRANRSSVCSSWNGDRI
jgi:hypothetical protein